jgi:hypothetical protein
VPPYCTVKSNPGMAEGPADKLMESPRNLNGGSENSNRPPIAPVRNLASMPIPHAAPAKSEGGPKMSVATGPVLTPMLVQKPPATEAKRPNSGNVDPYNPPWIVDPSPIKTEPLQPMESVRSCGAAGGIVPDSPMGTVVGGVIKIVAGRFSLTLMGSRRQPNDGLNTWAPVMAPFTSDRSKLDFFGEFPEASWLSNSPAAEYSSYRAV